MSQLLLFLTCITAGGILRVVYVLQRVLAKKTDILTVTIILDFLFCILFSAVFFLIMLFLNEGYFRFFMIFGIVAGFLLIAIFLPVPNVALNKTQKEKTTSISPSLTVDESKAK